MTGSRQTIVLAGLVAIFILRPAMAAPGGTHPRISIAPSTALEGDPVSIKVEGLAPNGTATLHLQSVSIDGGKKEDDYSEATFRADANGNVDLATAAPLRGSYSGADPRGLFWSARDVTADDAVRNTIATLHLDDWAVIGEGQNVLSLDEDGAVAARAVLTLERGNAEVAREDVRSNGIVGVFYCPKDAVQRPVLIALSGSEGGLDMADWLGPRLASRGFCVFGLDYFSPPEAAVPGVPTALARIPVESVAQVRAWLAKRPQADVNRVGIVGYSKGAEFALVSATTYEWIKAVVAYAPSDYVWQGIRRGGQGPVGSSWTRGGSELPFLPTTGTREAIQHGYVTGGKIDLADIAKANIAAASPKMLAAAAIPIETSHAALFLIGGGDDRLWDSGASVARLAARLERAHFNKPVEIAIYPGAGHDLVGTGWRPTTQDNTGQIEDGGAPPADAHAQSDSWPKVLAFLKRQLRP